MVFNFDAIVTNIDRGNLLFNVKLFLVLLVPTYVTRLLSNLSSLSIALGYLIMTPECNLKEDLGEFLNHFRESQYWCIAGSSH